VRNGCEHTWHTQPSRRVWTWASHRAAACNTTHRNRCGQCQSTHSRSDLEIHAKHVSCHVFVHQSTGGRTRRHAHRPHSTGARLDCSARPCTGSRTHPHSQSFRFARAFRRSLTPLHWAAAFGRAAVAELLLANGADVNAELKGGCGRSHCCVALSATARAAVWLLPCGRDGHRRRTKLSS
jgi:ankyrin repeat protein